MSPKNDYQKKKYIQGLSCQVLIYIYIYIDTESISLLDKASIISILNFEKKKLSTALVVLN